MTAAQALNRFDSLLNPDGPVAVTIRERLRPVEGSDAVFFPPTFAPAQKGGAPGYVIDPAPGGATAIVDTVGAQANRMEPMFKKPPLSALVPQASITIGERHIDLLDAGHRAADAVVRFSDRGPELKQAFEAIASNGDATRLAKLAPTSIVFGCWDSRDTQVKLPRIVGSRVRAFDVSELTRAAQYFSSFEKEETEELRTALELSQDALSEQGFSDAPSGRSAGGVLARQGIRRDATVNLIALRGLRGTGDDGSLKLRRYILGLSLVAALSPAELYLREGCLLVNEQPLVVKLVHRDGSEKSFDHSYDDILAFAQAAAQDFVVGQNWMAVFSKDAAKQALGATKAATKAAAKKPKK